MTAYYNEIDTIAAAVLAELIALKVIAPGYVDTRSIKEVTANDLKGFTQAHFFAGGGLWSVSARSAGWPDGRRIWTASCPCQPFSQAGKGRETDDERHLWPDVDRLVAECRSRGFGPPAIVGEQVAGKAGYRWFNGVRADLGKQGYRARVVDIPAAAVDAPNIRQRLYWVALADRESQQWWGGSEQAGSQHDRRITEDGDGRDRSVGRSIEQGLEGHAGHGDGTAGRPQSDRPTAPPDVGDLGDRNGEGQLQRGGRSEGVQSIGGRRHLHSDGRNGSFWADHEWIICHDGKARRTKPGLRLLADGFPGRVDLWRIAGNAINPVLATEVIAALLDITEGN